MMVWGKRVVGEKKKIATMHSNAHLKCPVGGDKTTVRYQVIRISIWQFNLTISVVLTFIMGYGKILGVAKWQILRHTYF